MEENLGKLKKTLSDSCPDCNHKGLQLRVRDEDQLIKGETILQEIHFHYCQRCGYEKEVKDKKFSKKRDWKQVEIPKEDLDRGKNKDKFKGGYKEYKSKNNKDNYNNQGYHVKKQS